MVNIPYFWFLVEWNELSNVFFTDMGPKESYGSSAIIMNVTFSKIKLRKGKLK